MTPISLSVVIPTRGDKLSLRYVLQTLTQQQRIEPGEFEVIVPVDGAGSIDFPGATCAAFSSRINVHCARHGFTTGAAATRNHGWLAATGRRVLFIDDDCLCPPTLLAHHANVAGNIALLGFRRHIEQHEWLGWPATNYPTGDLQQLPSFEETRARSKCRLAIAAMLRTGSPDINAWAYTCHISYPRPILERIGGFWEQMYGSGYEDRDLALRAHRAGVRFEQLPWPPVYHLNHPKCPLQGEHAPHNKKLFERTQGDPRLIAHADKGG